nr:AlkZ family DNA glycosylase [Clostridia bacterium]
MRMSDLILYRLHNQHLLSPGADPAADLCGLQAQFLRNAVHALRIRTEQPSVDDLVKTWTLRGTVHLVPERDLPLYIRRCGGAQDVCRSGWYQWTAGRHQANPPEREIELARLTLDAIAAGIDEREALRLHLRACGMTGQEEPRVFNPWGGMIAELANIGALAFRVEAGPDLRPVETRRYRLLAPFEPLEEAAARLELARRYFTHYGPATLRDAACFFHWTQAEVKALLAHLPVETAAVDGKTFFYIPNGEPEGGLPSVRLLAGFDPLMMGYRKEDNPFLPPEHLRGVFNLAGIVNPAILLHGRVVGKWKEKNGQAELTAFESIQDADRARIGEEVIRLFAPKKIKWE